MARPAAVAADGNLKVVWVTTLTTTAPTTTQLNAGTDLSYYLTADGLSPSVNQATVTDDRLADAQTFEIPGRYQFSLGDLRYVYNPTSSPDNAAAVALTVGAIGYFVIRFGLASATAWASAQKVDIWPATLGAPVKLPPTANSVLHMQQKAFVTNSVLTDVAVA